jgi:hypothetical protein
MSPAVRCCCSPRRSCCWASRSRWAPKGRLRLGGPQQRPAFGLLSWLAMLFAAGMGSGPVFWGVAEPLTHARTLRALAEPPDAVEATAIALTWFHWGLHAWAIYALSALAIAWFPPGTGCRKRARRASPPAGRAGCRHRPAADSSGRRIWSAWPPWCSMSRGHWRTASCCCASASMPGRSLGPIEMQAGDAWADRWTSTYLIWWIAWTPFVGLFIARISRGRTPRALRQETRAATPVPPRRDSPDRR